jgi:hypothetical protein
LIDGDLGLFYGQYYNDPSDESTNVIKQSDFKYMDQHHSLLCFSNTTATFLYTQQGRIQDFGMGGSAGPTSETRWVLGGPPP